MCVTSSDFFARWWTRSRASKSELRCSRPQCEALHKNPLQHVPQFEIYCVLGSSHSESSSVSWPIFPKLYAFLLIICSASWTLLSGLHPPEETYVTQTQHYRMGTFQLKTIRLVFEVTFTCDTFSSTRRFSLRYYAFFYLRSSCRILALYYGIQIGHSMCLFKILYASVGNKWRIIRRGEMIEAPVGCTGGIPRVRLSRASSRIRRYVHSLCTGSTRATPAHRPIVSHLSEMRYCQGNGTPFHHFTAYKVSFADVLSSSFPKRKLRYTTLKMRSNFGIEIIWLIVRQPMKHFLLEFCSLLNYSMEAVVLHLFSKSLI